MSAFDKLITDFAALTGLEMPIEHDSCMLESNGIAITLQYGETADEVLRRSRRALRNNEE